MLTVHHLRRSQSERVVWLCEEINVPYRLVTYERDPHTGIAPPEYKALHPGGTAPVICDDHVVLGESGAIVEYIARRYGGEALIVGPTHRAFPSYLYWFHYANGTMMPNALVELAVTLFGGAVTSQALTELMARAERAFVMVEQRLSVVPWFAGEEFTLSDIMMLFPLTTMRCFCPRDFSHYPGILAYLKRIRERSAFRLALEKGPFDLTVLG